MRPVSPDAHYDETKRDVAAMRYRWIYTQFAEPDPCVDPFGSFTALDIVFIAV
jgi:hypothetical protein